MDKHIPSLADYFDVAPVSLWLEDYSALKKLFEQWRAQGIVDLAAFLQAQPEHIRRCWDAVKVLRVNQRTLELFGASSMQELLEKMDTVLYSGEAREVFESLVQLWNLAPGQRCIQVQSISHALGGRRMELRISATILAGCEDTWAQVVSSVEDVSDQRARKRAEAELRESEKRWKLALDSTGDGVWDWHIQKGEEFYSKRHQEMFGYSQDEVPVSFSEFEKLIHPDDFAQAQRDRQAYFDGLTATYSNERRVRCKDGTWKWVLSRGMVVSRDAQGKPLRMIGTHTDISERKRSESLIWQQANFDALTGLPNRRMLHDRLKQDIIKGRRDGSQLALLFIDLDHFKEVNDTLGHDSGDQLLIEAARRIRECVRESDTVARMGGDEFTVLLPELDADTAHLERVLQAILQALAHAFLLGDEQVFVSASIGITMYPQDATELEGLFKNADQALYAAKDAGRNRFSFFTPGLQQAAQHRLRLANDLRSALGQAQFSVHYQSIVEMATGAIHKAEALLRWQHPVRGFVSPAEFIPVAESTGLIVNIGEWVFQQAAQQVKRWRALHDPRFQISVNRSPVQFHSAASDALNWVAKLSAMGLPGDALAVEITEGLLLDASAGVTEQLLELSDAGIQVSLDDFGTGYSSLSYLQRYDIDYLKIDQSFVRHLIPASTDLALCKAIIVMAHELGMKVVAEGVETPLQRDLLAAAGCDYAQGYLFSRPMTAEEFEALLAAQAGAPEPA